MIGTFIRVWEPHHCGGREVSVVVPLEMSLEAAVNLLTEGILPCLAEKSDVEHAREVVARILAGTYINRRGLLPVVESRIRGGCRSWLEETESYSPSAKYFCDSDEAAASDAEEDPFGGECALGEDPPGGECALGENLDVELEVEEEMGLVGEVMKKEVEVSDEEVMEISEELEKDEREVRKELMKEEIEVSWELEVEEREVRKEMVDEEVEVRKELEQVLIGEGDKENEMVEDTVKKGVVSAKAKNSSGPKRYMKQSRLSGGLTETRDRYGGRVPRRQRLVVGLRQQHKLIDCRVDLKRIQVEIWKEKLNQNEEKKEEHNTNTVEENGEQIEKIPSERKQKELIKNLDTKRDVRVLPRVRPTYPCDINCSQQFSSKKKLVSHQLNFHPDEYCRRCRQAFLTDHTCITLAAQCDVCKKLFRDKSDVKAHVNTCHRKRLVKCGKCNLEFKDRASFRDHRLTCEDREYVCDSCGYPFVTNDGLLKHIKLVHNSVKELFPCNLCDSKFRDKEYLESHKNFVHVGKVEAICELCSKTFMSMSHFNMHMRRFHSEKRYPCDVCNKKFMYFSILKTHKLNYHSEKKSLICDVCSGAFPSRERLLRHQRYHHRERKHVCDVCDASFPMKSFLARHQRSAHKGYTKKDLCQNTGKSDCSGEKNPEPLKLETGDK